jgi:ribosomal protein S18 acetylase RimI-like enzyme
MGEDRLRYTETWVYAHSGRIAKADAAAQRATQLYPSSDHRTPAQIKLLQAFARTKAGDVTEGIRHAQATYDVLPPLHRTTMVTNLAKQVLQPIPSDKQGQTSRRGLPGAGVADSVAKPARPLSRERAEFTRLTGERTLAMLVELADAYEDTRRDDPQHDDPLFSRSSFIARTEDQARRPGFGLVTVRAGDALAGFSFGFPFGAGRWWADASEPPKHILTATKFAVIELDVLPAYRGRGWGKALLNTLLGQRGEAYATLAALPDSQARAMYKRWGWYKVGTIGGGGPMMDAMVVDLTNADAD